MIPVLTRAQMRAFDRHAIETFHVPGIVLMENAGRGAADVLAAMIEASRRCERRANGLTPLAPNSPVTDAPPSVAEPGRAVPSLLPGLKHDHQAAARVARARSFPVRHVPSPGQPASYPLDAHVVIVCGLGNNGGDGYVVARHLLARGASVEVFLANESENVTGESRINHDAYIDLGGSLVEIPDGSSLLPLEEALGHADYIVDALFGTGLTRPIVGHLASIIDLVNRAECRTVALDIPSGLDADSGATLGVVVEADDTVTFGHLKIGLLTPDGARVAGNVHVVDLGVPDRPILAQVGHVAEVIRRETVASYLVPREPTVHKHEAGDVLVVAGSTGKLGAALLTATAAMRAGAGLATIATFPDAAAAIETRVVEVMTYRIDPKKIEGSLDEVLQRRRAVAIGPGFGLDENARAAVDHVVLNWDGVKVVDADALTHFVGRADIFAKAKGRCILTPHPGELGRLLGRSGREIEQDRFGAVREAVAITKQIVVLKGARTIIATPEGRTHISMAGNPALATAGAGDVLTGLIAAFACSLDAEGAACTGVLVHALAGDLWRARTGSDRGMLASEIASSVPRILAALRAGTDPLATSDSDRRK